MVGDGRPYRTAEKKTSNKEPSSIGMEVKAWLAKHPNRFMRINTHSIIDRTPGNYESLEGWRVTIGIVSMNQDISASADHVSLTSAIIAAYNQFRQEVL